MSLASRIVGGKVRPKHHLRLLTACLASLSCWRNVYKCDVVFCDAARVYAQVDISLLHVCTLYKTVVSNRRSAKYLTFCQADFDMES